MTQGDELERLLASSEAPPLRDPAAFVERVMASVQASPRYVLQPATPVPWWVQAATDPAAVLACLLLALLIWRPDTLERAARAVGGFALPAAWIAWPREVLPLQIPAVAITLELLGGALLAWVSFHLYRWTQRLTMHA